MPTVNLIGTQAADITQDIWTGQNGFKLINQIFSFLGSSSYFRFVFINLLHRQFDFVTLWIFLFRIQYSDKIINRFVVRQKQFRQCNKIKEVGWSQIHMCTISSHFESLEFWGSKPPLILVTRFARTNVADYVRQRFR